MVNVVLPLTRRVSKHCLNSIRYDQRSQKKFNRICSLKLGIHINRKLYDKEGPDYSLPEAVST